MSPVADTREAGGTDIRPIACLEIEASSPILPGAVPIEVAICDVDSGATKSWLVAPPHRRWGEAAWDPPERRPHKISPNILLAEGQPIEVVQAELTAAAAGHVVVSDAVLTDGALLRALYGQAPPFELGSISEVIRSLVRHLERRDALLAVGRATNEAFARIPNVHRARPDARRWAEVIRILRGIA
jgi:hypothetical protein